MPKISSRTIELKGSPIRNMAPLAVEAKKKGKTVYHLNIGQPDIPTPKTFMDAVRSTDIEVLSYSPSSGIARTVEALLGYYSDCRIPLVTNDLCVTIGGSEAFIFALQSTMDPGDEVLIPEPFYPNYKGNAQVAGVKAVGIPTYAEDGFRLPSQQDIEKRISSRTKAIMFSTPGNPTGVIYTKEEMELIAELALKHDLFVISDEVYREYVYEGSPTSILSFPELTDHAILVDSISKRISACGARIGVLASRNQSLMDTVRKMAQIRLSPPTFSQLGLAAFLNDPSYQDVIRSMISKFHSRRDSMYEAIQEIPNVICKRPAGAFYMFIKLPQLDNGEKFARWLLTDFDSNQETVMVAPGSGFYASPGQGKQELRLAYVLEEEKLVRAIEILAQGLNQYQKSTTKVTV